MIPMEFDEQNTVFAKDQPEYTPLPAHKTEGGEVVSKWFLSPEEIREISVTGVLWLRVWTFNRPLQPVHLSTKSPWEEERNG